MGTPKNSMRDTEVYRQHIRFDNSLIASDLDTYGGTIVVANPESPSTQPVLETANIAGRTFRIQDRISDGDNVLEPTYAVNLTGTHQSIDTSDNGSRQATCSLRRIRARSRSRPAELWVNRQRRRQRIALTLLG